MDKQDYLIYSVEDDVNIARVINTVVSSQGYQIQTFHNGADFLNALRAKKPQMILLDLMLPDISGQDLLKRIRDNADYDDVDIIIISAKHLTIDKVDGLALGADDYIAKPFEILELMARINAKVRRHRQNRVITAGNITLDLNRQQCFNGDQIVDLTAKEFQTLALLFQGKGKVVSRQAIIKELWDTDAEVSSRTVDMHVASCRNKLGPENRDLIVTVYGSGYRINI